MAGSKREKRPGVWELRVHISGGRYKHKVVRGTDHEADVALLHFASDTLKHRTPTGQVPTLGQVFEAWLSDKSNVTDETRRRYRYQFEKHAPANKKVDQIRPRDIRDIYRKMRQEKLGAWSIRGLNNILSAVLERLVTLVADSLDSYGALYAEEEKTLRRLSKRLSEGMVVSSKA